MNITASTREESAESKSFRKILVGYDGSENAKRALATARMLMEKFGSELVIIHAVSVSSYGFVGSAGSGALDFGKLKVLAIREAETLVHALGAQLKQEGVEARTEVVVDGASAVGAIAEFAQGEHVDLIVLGTRGLGGFKRLLLGSVSNGVVAHAPCAVLVVR
ncbi:MAG: universal stress protein [Thaumarchaeota archaeon]|nr:universal stress protein [Nitrososphaerota archaeon]